MSSLNDRELYWHSLINYSKFDWYSTTLCMCVRMFKSVNCAEIPHTFLFLAREEPNSAPSGKRSGLAASTGSFTPRSQTCFILLLCVFSVKETSLFFSTGAFLHFCKSACLEVVIIIQFCLESSKAQS